VPESVRANSPAEIIVVDGNSTDRTVEIAREYTERIYSDEGRGQSYARQLGAEAATQDYIAYVDSDVILLEDTLQVMLAEFRDSSYVSMRARESPDRECSNYWEWARLQHQFLHPGEHLSTCAGLFRRETILKYKFDTSAEHLDDIHLELRLRKEGYGFGTSSAHFHYEHDVVLRSLAVRGFLYGRWKPRAVRRFGPWHASFWPPLVTLYWLGFCLITRKLKLIPYFVVDGIIQTAGMVKGCFELVGEVFSRKRDSAR
jgi:glycosyltransferase involved in cell wall biosynthesis